VIKMLQLLCVSYFSAIIKARRSYRFYLRLYLHSASNSAHTYTPTRKETKTILLQRSIPASNQHLYLDLNSINVFGFSLFLFLLLGISLSGSFTQPSDMIRYKSATLLYCDHTAMPSSRNTRSKGGHLTSFSVRAW